MYVYKKSKACKNSTLNATVYKYTCIIYMYCRNKQSFLQ